MSSAFPVNKNRLPSNIALSPDGDATWSLPRHIGLKMDMEIALLGDRFDAERALELGLINRVVAPEQLAARPAKALAHTTALLNRSLETSIEAQLLPEQNCFIDCATHPDVTEGLATFFERRQAVYRWG